MPKARHVLIALPTTSQMMKSATALTVANVSLALERQGIKVDLHNIDAAEIVTARDMFANMVLHSDRWTDLFFIDSDMHFDSRVASRMIARNAEITAVAYTRRNIDLGLLVRKFQELGNLDVAAAHASSFTFKPSWDEKISPAKVVDGFYSGAAVGMGCTLISRTALTRMIEAKVVRRRLDLDAGPDRPCWSFFEPLEVDGIRLGEDYSFCHRWTAQMNRELWVCVDEAITHLGGYDYRARYLDRISAPAKPR
jgi:hypothetical protein